MAKKLLSEAQMRRFAKLANLSPINEMYKKRDEEVEEGMYKKRDEDEKMQEAAHDDEKMEEGVYMKKDDKEELEELSVGPVAGHHGNPKKRDDEEKMEEAEEPEMDMPEEPEMDMDEPEMDMDGDDLELTDEEAQAIIDLGRKLQAAMDMEGGEPEMDMGEPEMDMGDEEDMIAEALSSIKYVPEKKDIVEEVARRVAKRLLKAKKAQASLDEALGKTRK